MSENAARSIPKQALDEAIAWHARLTSGDAREADHEALAAWLMADPRHVEAFEAVRRRWDSLESARAAVLARFAMDRPALTQQGIKPAAGAARWHAFVAPLGAFLRARPWRVAAVAGALLVVGFLSLPLLFRGPQPQYFATPAGEVRTMELADGSTVHLDAASQITVTMTRDERVIVLREGAVLLEVTPDRARPFLVEAGRQTVRVVGTRFEVAKRDGKVAVAVARGSVVVAAKPASRPQAPVEHSLQAGERLMFAGEDKPPVKTRIDPARIGMWQSGQLVFDDAPLSAVVMALNRYFPDSRMVAADSKTANLRFTGVLLIADSETVAQRLSGLLPLRYQREGDRIVLTRSAED
ncbi:MAG: FecR family protein [Pseudomonadota bacterium]